MSDDVYRRIVGGDTAAYVEVIRAQATKVARGGLPHPDGRSWNLEDDVEELVSEYYLSSSYLSVTLSATNDDDLNALVYTAVRNQVSAKLRRTERARLRRRLKEILVEEGYVERPAKFWRRPTDPLDAFSGRLADLVEASWEVDVQLVRWRPDAKRNSPVAERQSFVAVLSRLLDVAAGAIHEDDLLDVAGKRFGVGPVSFTESLDVPEEREPADESPGPEEQVVAADEELESALKAASIWGQLSPRERALFPHLDLSSREAAAAVGGGKSGVNKAQRRLEAKMLTLLAEGDPDRREDVIRELRILAGEADN